MNDEQILINHYQHADNVQLAAMLGISLKAVRGRLYRLAKAGLIDLANRSIHRRFWTQDEQDRVVDMLRDGRGVRDIARALGRSPSAVHCWIERSEYGSIHAIRTGDILQVRSASQVAALLGVPDWKVGRWCTSGYLGGRRNLSAHTQWDLKRRKDGRPRTRNRTFLITDDALLMFIQDRRYWMLWRPEHITDPAWRDEAIEARRRAGGDWLTPQQVGDRLGYTASAVTEWVRRGQLPGTRVGHRLYIWSTDLDSFIPPGEAYLDRRQGKEHAA